MKFFLHSMGKHAIFLYFLCFCFCLGSPGAWAQSFLNVSGTVSDRGGPIFGATIQVKGASLGTLTDVHGYYQLQVQSTDTLVYSYLGYTTQTLAVDGREVIDVVLLESLSELEAVVVNAGYYTVSEQERTGSITGISAEVIDKQPASNVFQTLQGRLTGVAVSQSSGIPGGQFSIQIRGRNSISAGNAPLYVIDGVPYLSDSMEASYSQPLNGGGNPLQALNPADIANISVLKDADATAIYGSRGANGVILITTKRGQEGKSRVSVSVAQGAAQLTRFWDMLSTEQYLAMREEAFANDGLTPTVANAPDLLLWEQDRYTDWQRQLLGGTAEITEGQLSVSGGNATTNYRLGASFREQGSVFPGAFKNRKLSASLAVQHQSSDKRLSVQGTMLYSKDANLQPQTDPTLLALYTPPNAPEVYQADGSLNWAEGTWSNPYGPLQRTYDNTQYAFVGNSTLSYQVIKGLTAKVNAGFNRMEGASVLAIPISSRNPSSNPTGEAYFGNRHFTSWIVEPQLTYKKHWDKSTLEVLLGSSFQETIQEATEFYGSGYTEDALLKNMAAAPNLRVQQSYENQYRYMAVFGRINYNYKHKYILNLTARRDGSSRFGPGNRWGNFGAVGAAWLFSKESWFQDGVLSLGKLRASYGTTGNDRIADYGYLDSWSASYYSYHGQGGLYPNRLFNPDYGWEVNRKLEVALETGYWKDRVQLMLGWYRNRSSSQLVGQPLPGTTGFGSIQNNLNAKVQNTGWEFELHTIPVQHEEFTYRNSIALTIPNNELIAFPDLEASSYRNTYVVGQPLDIQKVYNYTGIDPETGLYTFEDVNGDGVITATEDAKTVRRRGRKWYGSFQHSIQYKGWEFQCLLDYVQQTGYRYHYDLGSTPGYLRNQPALVLDRWQGAATQGAVQAYTTTAAGGNAYSLLQNSTHAFTDASYLRLRQISLGYSFQDAWLQALHLQGLRLYVQAQNVWTLTGYDGLDPETQSSRTLPPLTTWIAGIQLSF